MPTLVCNDLDLVLHAISEEDDIKNIFKKILISYLYFSFKMFCCCLFYFSIGKKKMIKKINFCLLKNVIHLYNIVGYTATFTFGPQSS